MSTLVTALVCLVLWGALAFGGVYPWGYWSIAAGAAVIGGWALVRTRHHSDDMDRPAAWCLFAVLVTLTLQLVPLPLSAFEFLNPAGAAVLSAADLGYVVRPPAGHPLTLAPVRTEIVIAVAIALGLLFIGLVRVMPFLRIERVV